MNSRKSAFTLAETIMTLFIVGVVISASIPVFTTKQQKTTSDFCSQNADDARCLPWGTDTTNNTPGLYTNKPIVIGGTTKKTHQSTSNSTITENYNLTFYKNVADTSIYDIFKSNKRLIAVGGSYLIETKPDLTNGTAKLASSPTNLYVTTIDSNYAQPNTRANVSIGNNTIENYTKNNIVIGTGNTVTAGATDMTDDNTTRNNTIIGSNNTISAKVHDTLVYGHDNTVTQSDAVIIGNNNNDDETLNQGEKRKGKLVIGSNTKLNYEFNIGDFIFGDASAIIFGKGDGSVDTKVTPKVPLKADLEVFTFDDGITTATTSDSRLKNIKGSYNKGLNEILQVQPVTFSYKNDPNKEIHAGVIAQDIQKIFPEAVVTMPSGYLGVTQDPMFFAVLNALKEINEKTIEEEKRHEQLEKELNALVSEIESIEQCKNAGLWDKFLCKISSIKRKILLWLPVNSEVNDETV